MSGLLLASLGLLCSGLVALFVVRRAGHRRLAQRREELLRARERGSHKARLQVPEIDLTRCVGCGTCVRACPEDGVLEIVHGQAMVVHGSRCVGHARCAAECPTGAIAVVLGDLASRRDIPALGPNFEVPGVPGLFLGGELTGFALIKTAITHGTAIADEVARRIVELPARTAELAGELTGELFDLCVIGAGPAGFACSLQAKAHGLSFVTLEQETLGGTVSKYPRKKLVMTQPVELPLHGRLDRTSFQKEELVELWAKIALQHALPIRTGVRFDGLRRGADGTFDVVTDRGSLRARHVCLALGRRGVPRKLGVPGEELSKVTYGLIDAQSYRQRRILVVGGGDSAIEAALALSEQPGNAVTLSYRQKGFSRIKARNEERIERATSDGSVRVLFQTRVHSVAPETVELVLDSLVPPGTLALPNDDVFVLAGGIPPFELLEKCGVSFDPAARPEPALRAPSPRARPTRIAVVALLLAGLGWVLFHWPYYRLPLAERPDSELYELLRPAGGAGLWFGAAAVLAILVNLLYLLRRSPRIALVFGSLRRWMSLHVATGVAALCLALLHAGLAPRHTLGGHALLGLIVLVTTGAIGRYLYAFVPRAANGRELELLEARAELARLAEEWRGKDPALVQEIRAEIDQLVAQGAAQRSVPARILALRRQQSVLARALVRLGRAAAAAGLGADEIRELQALARRVHRSTWMAAHYEELRGLLASWRHLHRWIALLLVLLVLVHVFFSLRYGELFT